MATEVSESKNALANEIKQVSNPLTLVLNIKSPEDALALQQLLAKESIRAEIDAAMTKIGTVHFARFVFLSPLELAVITTYDGDFDKYIQAFTDELGDIFNTLLKHVKNTEGIVPVQDNLKLFQEFIKKNDRSRVNGVLQSEFSAYPTLTVYDILSCQSELNS